MQGPVTQVPSVSNRGKKKSQQQQNPSEEPQTMVTSQQSERLHVVTVKPKFPTWNGQGSNPCQTWLPQDMLDELPQEHILGKGKKKEEKTLKNVI